MVAVVGGGGRESQLIAEIENILQLITKVSYKSMLQDKRERNLLLEVLIVTRILCMSSEIEEPRRSVSTLTVGIFLYVANIINLGFVGWVQL